MEEVEKAADRSAVKLIAAGYYPGRVRIMAIPLSSPKRREKFAAIARLRATEMELAFHLLSQHLCREHDDGVIPLLVEALISFGEDEANKIIRVASESHPNPYIRHQLANLLAE